MKRFFFTILVCLMSAVSAFAQNSSFELKLIAKFDADLNKYGQIGFSSDGKFFFALGYRKNLQVWETETQKRLYTINGKFESANFSHDGKLLAVFTEKDGLILESVTGNTQLNLNIYREKIRFLNWSSNNKNFAVGTENFDVDVWNAETGKGENSFRIHEKKKGFWAIDESAVYWITAEFSHDEKRLLTNCYDYESDYWDLESGKRLRVFTNKLDYSRIFMAKFSPDGKWIATYGSTETNLWNSETGNLIKSFSGYSFPSFSPDSRYFGIVPDSISGKLFDLSDQKSYLNLQQDFKNYGTIAAWSPDSQTFVTVSENGLIWNATTKALINTFKSRITYSFLEGYSNEDSYDYHPDSKILMVQNDKELRFFSAVRNEQLLSFPQAKRPAAWSPDGKFLLAQTKEKKKVALWKVTEK